MNYLSLVTIAALSLAACGKKQGGGAGSGPTPTPGACSNSKLKGTWIKPSATFVFGSDCSFKASYTIPVVCNETGSYKDLSAGSTSGPVDVLMSVSTCDSGDDGQTIHLNYTIAPGGLILN